MALNVLLFCCLLSDLSMNVAGLHLLQAIVYSATDY